MQNGDGIMFKTHTLGMTDATVTAFRATGLGTEFVCGAQVMVFDRNDGMTDFALQRRALRVTGPVRAGSLDVIIEKDPATVVLARLDSAGKSNLELVKRLNHTGFCGTLVFAGEPTGRTSTLLRLLSELAIDFQVTQRSFTALDDSLPMTFNAA